MQVCVDLESQLIGKICFNNWTIYVLYFVSSNLLQKYLKNIDCPFMLLQECIKNYNNSYGFTYSNKSEYKSIIYLNKHESISELINTISHESSHLIYHINNKYSDEVRSTLIGNLSELIFNKFVLKS